MLKKSFKNILSGALLLMLFSCKGYSPVAWEDDQVRFTVVSDGVIRMEWAEDGMFCDDASFLHTESSYDQCDYKVSKADGMLTITTAKMELCYKLGTGKFAENNLKITSAENLFDGSETEKNFTWTPGTVQQNNLKGTYRTLDGYQGSRKGFREDAPEMPIEDGILATDGWTLLDDSEGLLFDNDPTEADPKKPLAWVKERSETAHQDWYFLAYGHNYKAALKDFTLISGRIPLPPRFAFGYWWSRYWEYSEQDIRDLVANFESLDLPIDVLVIDMDWHYADGKRGGWTGYTWNKELFPNPDQMMSDLHDKGLKLTFNIHPADGVSSVEEHYADFAKWLGKEPVVGGEKIDTLKWLASDKHYMQGWAETILRPLEKQGVDFWWLDWQQGLQDRNIKKLGNTFWLNYFIFTDMLRNRDARPMLYHRWGGLGNHRYQIGFSGDSFSTWESLEFQPYFNSTASNVLYGYWSHDIGGHQLHGRDAVLDEELYIRWMQLGVFLPIMRTHSTKDARLHKEPWSMSSEEYKNLICQTILDRYKYAPYIYTAARESYDTGVSMCRPMYYDYPEATQAYAYRNEYMLGNQMLIAPVSSPIDETGVSRVKVWLPAGNDWYEVATGEVLKGGAEVERTFTLSQFPLYIKTGTIIPTYGKVKSLARNDEDVILEIVPGAESGSGEMYEDNGNDQNYADEYAKTCFSYNTEADGSIALTIGERVGKYKDMPATRNYSAKVLGKDIKVSIKTVSR